MSTSIQQVATRLTQQMVQDFTSRGSWRNKLLTDFLDVAVAASPDQVALIDARGSLTYREFSHLVNRAAHGFLKQGIHPGDTISIQMPNWNEWLIVHYAALLIGAITHPLIPVFREREIVPMLNSAHTKLLVVAREFRGFNYPNMLKGVRSNLPNLRRVLVVDALRSDLFTGADSWDEFIATPWERHQSNESITTARPDPNDIALLMFTSGTTGVPKGVLHSHNSLIAGSLPWPDQLGMDHSSVIHMASTFGHLTGYLYGVALPIMVGGTAVFQDVWSPDEFLRLVDQFGIEHTSGATPFLVDILNSSLLESSKLESLKRFCCMGAPIPRTLLERAQRQLPGTTVFGGWGQTENCLVTMCAPGDSIEKISSTDGKANTGMQIRVVGADGEVLPSGQEGELQVRGPFLFLGYLGGLEQTQQSFDGEWFMTGDLATIDGEGYIRISGRTKDMIIRGGENIPVAYVENILYQHPLVATAALIALPHPRLQEIAVAVLQLTDRQRSLGLAEVQDFFEAQGVAKPYWPERVLVLPDLPRTPSGKIQKFHLRAQVLQLFGYLGQEHCAATTATDQQKSENCDG